MMKLLHSLNIHTGPLKYLNIIVRVYSLAVLCAFVIVLYAITNMPL